MAAFPAEFSSLLIRFAVKEGQNNTNKKYRLPTDWEDRIVKNCDPKPADKGLSFFLAVNWLSKRCVLLMLMVMFMSL